MKRTYLFILLFASGVWCDTNIRKRPTVLIEILVRNKAHTLPYFLSFLEQLDYPKDRISLWIRSDNNVDNSIEILKTWLKTIENNYHAIDSNFEESSQGFDDEEGISHWSPNRFAHIINLREEALSRAKQMWADYIWVLDADVFLTNPRTLKNLIAKNTTLVAPLLKSDGLYSNFWAGMTENYYYLRTERYEPIVYGDVEGCHDVAMIHSAVLIDLRTFDSDRLTYESRNLPGYDGPNDDIITFAMSANKSGIPLTICNDENYGFITVPLENQETVNEDVGRLINLKIEILNQENRLILSENLEKYVNYLKPDTLSLDNIFMINLLRRSKRRERMQKFFQELGMKAEIIDAVDGKILTKDVLEERGIKSMPEYSDPYKQRAMTMGEIGCSLSHYIVWNKVLERDYDRVMVLEDDIRFEPFFRQKINFLLKEVDKLNIEWDLIYLGRKKLLEGEEVFVKNSSHLVYAQYSYWTLGYLLSNSGAEKLVQAEPLKKLLPVDEYIPVLSNTHPRQDWKIYYEKRDLITLSAQPLLIYPSHYTGEQGYISDTEDSRILPQSREEL